MLKFYNYSIKIRAFQFTFIVWHSGPLREKPTGGFKSQVKYKALLISLRSILILSSHLRLGLPRALFPIGFPDKIFKIKICKTIILPVVLYGCETWSLILREERRIRVFENKILRRIFGHGSEEGSTMRNLIVCTVHLISSG